MEGKQGWVIGAGVVVLLAGTAWWLLSPGPKLSESAYQYTMALFSVCNRQDSDGLDRLTSQLETAEKSGEITKQEATRLKKIVGQAENGAWAKAAASSRALMEQQIEAAPVLP